MQFLILRVDGQSAALADLGGDDIVAAMQVQGDKCEFWREIQNVTVPTFACLQAHLKRPMAKIGHHSLKAPIVEARSDAIFPINGALSSWAPMEHPI